MSDAPRYDFLDDATRYFINDMTQESTATYYGVGLISEVKALKAKLSRAEAEVGRLRCLAEVAKRIQRGDDDAWDALDDALRELEEPAAESR